MTELLRLRGISRRIPNSAEMAVKDGTGTINRGEFVCIIGPSGSGKTTLLAILGLLDRPSTGEYLFDGVDVETLSESRRNHLRGTKVGFVFQNSYLVPEESTERNVALGLRVRGVKPSEQSSLVVDVLRRVGLESAMSNRAGNLSGGERQRAALARAVVTGPDVILADEPTGALDSESTARLIRLLQDINASGTTVIVVTHDPLMAAAAGRTLRIDDGVLHASQPNRPAVARHFSRAGATHVAKAKNADHHPAARCASTRTSRLGQEIADGVTAPLLRPWRALLVLLAYVLGIGAVVAATGILGASTGQIVKRLTDEASNEIIAADTSPSGASWQALNTMTATITHLEGVLSAAPVRTFATVSNTITRLRGANTPFAGRVIVTDDRFMATHGMHASFGSPDLLSNQWNGPGVAVGATAAETLFVGDATPGITLWVNDRPVPVVAILAQTGDALLDDAVYLSPGSVPVLTDPVDSLVDVHTKPGYAEPLATAIPLALEPTNPGEIQVSTVAQLANLEQGISHDLSNLMSIIGWVVLATSTLAAGATMFLSVQHRSPEIALRRAMGASRLSIFRLFAVEGSTTGLLGGMLGTGLGAGLTSWLACLNGWPLAMGLPVVLLGLAAGLGAGMVASIVPAVYAARQDPAQILRGV